MAKAKSKDFILKRGDSRCQLHTIGGVYLRDFCWKLIKRYFGIELEPGEKKRVRITMKVVKK